MAWVGEIGPQELIASLLFSPVLRVVRYFNRAADHAVVYENEKAAAIQPNQTDLRIHVKQLSRHVLGDFPDDPEHKGYAPVLSDLLPGERLVLSSRNQKQKCGRS